MIRATKIVEGEITADRITITKLTAPMHDETIAFPAPVGYWVISDSFHVPGRHRPSRWNRFWTKMLLGWQWEESPDGR